MKTSRAQARLIGRLLKRADFLRVQKNGVKWVTPHLILQMAPMPDGGGTGDRSAVLCRFGLTATKKIFPNATDRNRVRRRLRALMIDILVEKGVKGVDFVVLPRVPALKSASEDLEKDLKWAIKRILTPKEPSKSEKQHKNDQK